jgi:hypothetical protein
MVTLAGANTFEIGNIVSQYSVSTSGAISLSMPTTPSGGASTNRLPTLMNILGLPYTNLQSQAYAAWPNRPSTPSSAFEQRHLQHGGRELLDELDSLTSVTFPDENHPA